MRHKIQGTRHRIQDSRLKTFHSLLVARYSLLACVLLWVVFPIMAQSEEVEQVFDAEPSIDYTSDPEIQSYVSLYKAVYWKYMGDYGGAKRHLESAIQLVPESSFLHASLAETMYVLSVRPGSVEKDLLTAAESECRIALSLDPDNVDAHFLLGVLSLRKRDREGAVDEFKKATELNPGHLRAQSYLGDLLMEDQDYKGAALAYSELVKVQPYNHRLRLRLGISYSRSGETEKAIKELSAATKLRSDYLEPHFYLARLYAQQSMNKEAVRECMIVLSSAPEDPDVNLLLAEIYVSMDEFDEAIAISDKILKRRRIEQTKRAEAQFRLAAAYKGKEEAELADFYFQESIDTYEQVLDNNPSKIEVHYDIAMVYEARGDLELAEQHLRRYIELDPDEPNTYNFLGYMLVESDKNLEEARALIEKAVEMDPKNGAFRDSLGWAHFKLGDVDEAITELEKAVEFMPEDSAIREHLGEAYLKKGGKFAEKAILEWERSLEIKPNNPSLQQRLVGLRRSLEQVESVSEGL